jgi:DNA-directed RNA polymerase subunit K/omega
MPKVYFTEEVTGKTVNPYEAVLLSSRESRRLNKARLNAGVPEGEEKVTTVALRRLVDKKISHTYDDNDADSKG